MSGEDSCRGLFRVNPRANHLLPTLLISGRGAPGMGALCVLSEGRCPRRASLGRTIPNPLFLGVGDSHIGNDSSNRLYDFSIRFMIGDQGVDRFKADNPREGSDAKFAGIDQQSYLVGVPNHFFFYLGLLFRQFAEAVLKMKSSTGEETLLDMVSLDGSL